MAARVPASRSGVVSPEKRSLSCDIQGWLQHVELVVDECRRETLIRHVYMWELLNPTW